MANFKVRRVDFWNAAINWAEVEEEYPHTLILGYSLQRLFIYHVWKEYKL